MKTQLKFRAFDTQGGMFEYWDAETNKHNGIFWELIKNKSFREPQQYSTIKDKNGKEIYTGDIFKLGAEKEVFEVRFEYGCFMAFCNGKQYGLIGELQICFIDVIGNIYQSVCDICNQPLTSEELKVGHCFNCGER